LLAQNDRIDNVVLHLPDAGARAYPATPAFGRFRHMMTASVDIVKTQDVSVAAQAIEAALANEAE
jgi:hypothetical protein